MGAKPSTQQPIRPRSDTFPHNGNSLGGTAGGSAAPFHTHQGNGTPGASSLQQRHSSGSRALPSTSHGADAAAIRRLRSMSAVEALTSSHSHHRTTTLSGSDSDDSSPETENSNFTVLRIPGSLPLRLFQLAGIKCPVCGKQVASENVEVHLVECLTKPRIIYNEDVLTEVKGECVICFDDMSPGQTIARLPCLCIYHKRCIDSWFKVNRSCPEHPGD